MKGLICTRDKLNVAVIGQGWWGKAIVRTLQNSSKMRVVKAVDVNPAAREFVEDQGIEFDTDYKAAVADPNVDAVILCTPHSLHTEQVTHAANMKKHVFCEKPLALTRRDALTSVEVCDANGVVLGIGHEHRFKPPMQELTKMVKEGQLGTIMQTEATFAINNLVTLDADNWRMSNKEAPAGPMTAVGIHALDLCVGLHGAAESVFASCKRLANPVIDDTLGILISFKSGANALITALMATPFALRFAVYGRKGWVEVRDKAHPEKPEGWILTKCLSDGKTESIEYSPTSPVLTNLEAFADAACGRAPYLITQAEIVENISAFEAIVKSVESGQIEKVE